MSAQSRQNLNLEYVDSPSTNLSREVQEALASAGQALSADAWSTFALINRASDGELRAAALGDVAFTSVHISYLYVAEALRGRGIGGALLDAVEDIARKRGCDRIHLETRSDRALRLYQRCGFDIFGELPRYAGDQSLFFLQKAVCPTAASA